MVGLPSLSISILNAVLLTKSLLSNFFFLLRLIITILAIIPKMINAMIRKIKYRYFNDESLSGDEISSVYVGVAAVVLFVALLPVLRVGVGIIDELIEDCTIIMFRLNTEVSGGLMNTIDVVKDGGFESVCVKANVGIDKMSGFLYIPYSVFTNERTIPWL
jgi:hypothetical protein